MAGKVNTKFILIVGAVVAVVTIAAAYVAVESVRKTGDDYIELGDKALAEKKVPEAISLYGKAVFKDQRNPAWLKKWVGAMEQEIPANRNAYQDRYLKEYIGGLQRLAEAQPSDYAAQRRWLQERWAMLTADKLVLGTVEQFIAFVEQTVKGFTGSEDDRKRLMRYRGLASLVLLAIKADMKDADLQRIREDLAGALSVDPTDTEVAIALGQLDWARSVRAFERDDKPEVARLNAELLAFIAKYIEDHPPAAEMRRFELLTLVKIAAQSSTEPLTVRDVLQDRQGRVQEMGDAFVKEKPESLKANSLPEVFFLISTVLPKEEGAQLVESIKSHMIKGRGDDPELLVLSARIQMEEGKLDEAIATLDKVIALPDRPMSLDGLLMHDYRAAATKIQTDAAFGLWEKAAKEKNLEMQAQAAQKARALRQRYVERIPQGESDVRVQPIDAKLALIDGDIRGATTLLDRYNKATAETDPEIMFLMAVLLRQQANNGAARAAFERVVQIADEQRNMGPRRGSIEQLAQIAELNRDRAEELKWRRVQQQYDPDNKDLANRVAVLETLIAQQANPNLKATGEQGERVEAQKLLEQVQAEVTGVDADPRKAEATLRDAMKKPAFAADIRFHEALITILAGTGRKEEAAAAVDAALLKFPEGREADALRQFRERLLSADPVADALAKIDAATLTPLQKRLSRYDLYRRANKPAEATAELAEAAKLAPEDPVVVDAQFEEALAAKNTAEIERLAKLAEEKNLDQAKGRLFRSRVLMVGEQFTDAATLLRGVVEGDRFNALAWRLLGYCYAAEGEKQRLAGDSNKYREEYGRAAEAFTRAYEIKNTDVATINGYIQSLAVTQRPAEALAIARKAEAIAAGNRDFVETLIKLESAAPGGDRNAAIRLRQNLAQARPENADNQGELAVLLMQKRQWDDAKAIIEKLRESPDHKGLVASLEVRWLVLQDRLTEAEKLITDYIAAQPAAERNEGPYLAASKLFKEVNRPDLAIKFLEKGRDLQDKKGMLIDRELGDTLFNMIGPRDDARGNTQKAVEAYTRVLDAGSEDRENRVAHRLLECYLRLGNWPAFDDMMKSLGETAKKDSTLLVLAAEAARAQGDTAGANRYYDQAVASDSSNPAVFIKRGLFFAEQPDKERDAIADLDQAARLAPGDPTPLAQLADLHSRAGRSEEAMRYAMRALAIQPTNDALRSRVVAMRTKAGDVDGALSLVDEAIELSPDSTEWRLQGGRLALDSDRADRAVGYLRPAWEKEKSLRIAIALVTTLLSKTPKDIAGAESVVNDPALVEAAGKDKAAMMPYRMLRTMALVRAENPRADEELALAIASLDVMDFGQVQLFMSGLGSTYLELSQQIEALDRMNAKSPLTGYLRVQALMLKMQQESTREAAARELTSVADAEADPNLRIAVYRLLGSFHFQLNQPAASVAAYQKLLALSPNDLEALNNAAYIMATKTGQASEARLLADRALELAPDSATVLDTVATVYHQLKDSAKATEMYKRALLTAKSDNERAPVLLHLAKVLIEQGQKSQAETHLTAARRMLTDNPQLEQQFGAELKDLLRQIDGQ